MNTDYTRKKIYSILSQMYILYTVLGYQTCEKEVLTTDFFDWLHSALTEDCQI